LIALLTAAVSLPLAVAPPPAAPSAPAATDSGGEGIQVTELALEDGEVPSAPSARQAPAGEAESAVWSTTPFTVLGISWADTASDVTVRFRAHGASGWSAWRTTEAGEGEMSGGRVNTDALVVEESDGLEVRLTAGEGELRDVKTVIIDPGEDPAALRQSASEAGATVRNAALVTPAASSIGRPAIITRAQWGADESLRGCASDHTTSLVAAAVHHTDSVNTYSADAAAGIIRGIYAYHTRSEAAGGRGWCDIGYNALVDRFGRVYEGRLGSFDESVVGVHTGGFNSRTFGVSVVGNYVSTVPSAEVLEGVSQAIAWKFATERILANTSVSMVSGGGASKYPEGTTVTFPTIYGHRDAQFTSCPGEQLYARLGLIRNRVAELANEVVHASPAASWEATRTTAAAGGVGGWGFDPSEPTRSLVVDAVVDGASHPVLADRSRPDVANAYPGAGAAHGFSVDVPVSPGRHTVCLWVRNVGPGVDQLLGCRDVTAVNAAPVGFVDQVVATPSSIRVAGWALDTDAGTAPVDVHVYVNGAHLATARADGSRPDIGAAYPAAGAAHGFSLELPVAAGAHWVCVYAINAPAGANPSLGCRDVTVVNATPVGFLDRVTATPSSVRVAGWALDADAGTGPVDVHVYVDGRHLSTARADASRPDIGRAYPAAGAAHGFDLELPVAAGAHRVCVYVINTPTGYNPSLGCRDVTVVNAAPVGFLDQVVAASPSSVRVSGWALDTDAGTAPVDVHVYVDGGYAGTVRADAARPDIGAAYPAAGAAHGFSGELTVAAGAHRVCAYAINTPAGYNPAIGCRDVAVG
jgi:uncharacterized membrane protein